MSLQTLWVEKKYCNFLSPTLRNFSVKKQNPFRANFSCPICGDSNTNRRKARGWFIEHKGSVFFKCFNCGTSMSFHDFIKRQDYPLYEEYNVEIFLEKNYHREHQVQYTENVSTDTDWNKYLRALKKISQLKYDHPAKKYILNRKIENYWHSKIYYCPKFANWVNSMIPNKLSEIKDTPRLIIPLLDENKKMFGFLGRSFDHKDKQRYITIMLEDVVKIFGLDTVNKTETVYVVEGPIDSMFLPNAIAMVGADLKLDSRFSDPVYIFDNEPRNVEICRRIDKKIKDNYKVCIWDRSFTGKDINDMILNGADQEHIKIVIDKRTFRGLEAKVEFNKWKKCDL